MNRKYIFNLSEKNRKLASIRLQYIFNKEIRKLSKTNGLEKES